MNPTANNASIARVMQTRAEVKTRFRNKVRSMIGSVTRFSTTGSASNAAKLTAKQQTTRQELQPHSVANDSASVSGAQLAASKTAPNGSNRWRTMLAAGRSTLCAPTNPQTPIGRLTQKIQRQLQCSVI